MLTRSRLRPVSKKRNRQKREQSKAYGAAEDAEQSWCSCCGATGLRVAHSHLLSQKHYPEYRNNPLNWLLKCRSCHQLFEDHKERFAQQHPEAWAGILVRIAAIDPQAFAAFRLKNPF